MEFVKAEDEAMLQTERTVLKTVAMIDVNDPIVIQYCPTCSMPPEFCEFGTCFDKCLPWIAQNCPEVLSEGILTQGLGSISLEEGKTGGEVS
jgi:hypothetical protein